jgi:hypothetical protein
LDGTLKGLSPTAGPPEKILRYLGVLRDYARAVSTGTLGKSVEKWFEDKGVICSGESSTVSTNKKDQEQRTWSVGGERVTCRLHLKPSDGTSPERCVRIYFVPPENGKVRIGYIGRHF